MRLKEQREAKGLKQDELAVLVGVTQGAISQWEKGAVKPSFDNIRKLAAALEITIDELMEES